MRSLLWIVLGTCVLGAAGCGMKFGGTGDAGNNDPWGNSPHAESVNVKNCSSTYALALYKREAGVNVVPVFAGDVGALFPANADCDESGQITNVDLGPAGHTIELTVVYWTLNENYNCPDDSYAEGCKETFYFESVANAGIYTFEYNK